MKMFVVALLLGMMLFTYGLSAQVPVTSVAVQKGQSGNPVTIVWVDTAKGVYYCPGNQSYDKGNGQRMRQSEAQQKGYRPAYGWVCK